MAETAVEAEMAAEAETAEMPEQQEKTGQKALVVQAAQADREALAQLTVIQASEAVTELTVAVHNQKIYKARYTDF